MSVGFMSGGKLITCATKDDIAFLPAEGVDDDGIWHIYTAEGLLAWRDAVNSDSTASACLHSDIDMEGVEWSPPSAAFTGTFDGGGHAIKNLRCDTNSETYVYGSYEYRGLLFPHLSAGGRASNIVLDDAYLSYDASNAAYLCCGLITGWITSGATISDCHVNGGELKVASESSYVYAGGAIGHNYGTASNVAASKVDVSAYGGTYNTNSGIPVLTCAGGAIGYATINVSNVTLSRSIRAAASCKYTQEYGSNYYGFHASAGGLFGSLYYAVINGACLYPYASSSSSGDNVLISATAESGSVGAHAGGIAGSILGTCFINDAIVRNSYGDPLEISATGYENPCSAGGIVGYVMSGSHYVLKSCMVRDEGNITATAASGDAECHVGGIVGRSNTSSGLLIEECVNKSTVSQDVGNW